MNAAATALLPLAITAGIADWWAVARGDRGTERWLKPLTMAALVGVAIAAGASDRDVRPLLVAGAVLGLVGDVALLGATERRFMAGLAAFAIGHVCYAAAALQVGWSSWAAVGAAGSMVLLAWRFATRTLRGARRLGGNLLAGTVACYGLVISLMTVAAWGMFDTTSPAWMAGVGALLFAVSDWVLGHVRFAGPLPGGRLAVMVPYHVGQTLLILGIALA